MQPMLAVNLTGEISFPVMCSPKIDGIRCLVIDSNAVTRQIKNIPNLFTRSTLSNVLLNGMDGELVVGSPTDKLVYKNTIQGIMSHTGVPDFSYIVFDCLDNNACYSERLDSIQKRIECINLNERNNVFSVRCINTKIITSKQDLLKYEEEQLWLGYEGVIIRNPNSKYKNGRSTLNVGELIKLKRFNDDEAIILKINKQYDQSDLMSSFTVRDIKTNVIFNIGSGFTEHERNIYWEQRDNLLGDVVKYKHFQSGAGIKPRFNTFIGFRDKIDM